MTSYHSLISDYKKEFKTYKDIRRFLPERRLILLLLFYLLALVIGALSLIKQEIILLVLYLAMVAIPTFLFLKMVKAKSFERVKIYNRIKLCKFIADRVSWDENDRKAMLRDLLSICSHRLTRIKPSIKIKNGFVLTILSPTLGFIPTLFDNNDWDSQVMITIALLALMGIGMVISLAPIFNFIFNRGYEKEEEFRMRIENLLLNYDEKDWDI